MSNYSLLVLPINDREIRVFLVFRGSLYRSLMAFKYAEIKVFLILNFVLFILII
jgi:hypothetical protein